ncbi:MAG: hypothetical protein H0T89_10320 [Deltaproteobacteria bacterium]|nr:hypothetical protein [Deltaproteobacteria bacterium]MDQ3296342.1 hypothetical protein [Myxococcota bacterium]
MSGFPWDPDGDDTGTITTAAVSDTAGLIKPSDSASFLERARALAGASSGRIPMRVSGARVGDLARPVAVAPVALPTKRLGLRVHGALPVTMPGALIDDSEIAS